MDAQTNQVLGKLEEVATTLDTAPEAYRAHWSPDSKHVSISSRGDRHWTENIIYRIENRRAYAVETPELICGAVPDFCRLTKELGYALTQEDADADYDASKPWKARQKSSYSEIVKWISPTQFVVREESQFQVRDHDPSASLDHMVKSKSSKTRVTRPAIFITFGSGPKGNANFSRATKRES